LKIQQLSSTEGELDVVGHLINTPITAGLYLAGGLIFHPGSTSLHVAAWTRRPGLIEKLISNGAKPNVQNSVGRTPLHFAADIGCKDSVRALLDNGAIATLQDSSLMTPLMITCSNGSIPTVQLLTVHEHGRHIIDAHGQSALHHSAKSAGFQAFIHLLEAGWDPYQTDTVGRSSINLALGDRIFLTYILNADLDLEHLMPKGAHSIFYGNAHLLRLFLRRFPEEYRQRLVNHKHTIWEPPLCYAARCTDIVSMEVMIGAGANIEIQDAMGRTALIFACLAGCLDPVKLLVRNGAKLQYNVMGQSVSAFEAAHNHEKITTWLLVLRHTEYRRISNVDHTEGRSLKYWSGVRQLEIPLEGYFSRKLGQSRWDWVRSIHDRKESWRTMVPLDWDPASHIAPLFVRPKYSLDRDTV
jgi:ankyrin repeat protein